VVKPDECQSNHEAHPKAWNQYGKLGYIKEGGIKKGISKDREASMLITDRR